MRDEPPLFCDRCSAEIHPGRGDYFVVKIEAVADPVPPDFSLQDVLGSSRQELDRLVREMSELSAQDAMDQVYRRLQLHLCLPCYREWIENPTG